MLKGHAANNGWEIRGKRIEKDGYEIFFTEHGAELSIGLSEGDIIMQVTHLAVESPAFTAVVAYMIKHSETIVAREK